MTPSALLVAGLAGLASGALGAAIRSPSAALVSDAAILWAAGVPQLRPVAGVPRYHPRPEAGRRPAAVQRGGAAPRRAERAARRLEGHHPGPTHRLEGSGA